MKNKIVPSTFKMVDILKFEMHIMTMKAPEHRTFQFLHKVLKTQQTHELVKENRHLVRNTAHDNIQFKRIFEVHANFAA